MTLYMIGLGLGDKTDITVKGLEIVKGCDFIYLESYTSLLKCSKEELEKFYGKNIILADRKTVESEAENTILKNAKQNDVAFLVIGDVFGATTHTDLKLRAIKDQIKVVVISNASVMNAVGITGLELYKFGKTTSIPFDNKSVTAPYDVIKQNQSIGLHTLLLLDLKPKQDKFMTVNDAIEFLLTVGEKKKENLFTEDSFCIGCARLGQDDYKIKAGKASELLKENFGKPLHCLIVPGELHFIEEESLALYS